MSELLILNQSQNSPECRNYWVSADTFHRLDELSTRNARLVETLLLGAVITFHVSRRLLRTLRERLRGYTVQDARAALGHHR